MTASASPARPKPRWAKPKASKTCTSSPTTSKTGRYTDHGAVFYPDGQRPLYVNAMAIGKDGMIYTLPRITANGKARSDLIAFPGPLKK